MQVTVDGMVIADGNAALDRDGVVNNVIEFDSALPGIAFALPANLSVQAIRGKAEIAFAGTVVQFLPPGGVSLVLTDLEAATLAGAGNQQLVVTFEHTFLAPAAPVVAGDAINGDFFDRNFMTMNGSSVQWSAFVNGQRIQPPNAPFNLMNGPGEPPNVPIAAQGGQMVIAAGGPPWVLKGELIIQLALPGHELRLPLSAEIGIAPAPRSPQQEQQVTVQE